MAKNKTTYTEVDVIEFIHAAADTDHKRQDCLDLLEIMQDITGCEPKMWGPTIIGFGSYHYKYASGHEGDAPMIGFSPRKVAFSLYIYSDTEKSNLALEKLGKFKMSKACIYVKKLSDIHIPALKEICTESIRYLNEHHQCSCKPKV